MYLDYWNLKKHPFNNVPDPAMYFDMHQSVDNAVSEILFAVEEANECLAVAVGPVGVGKTTCLRIVLNSLAEDKYNIAFVTNPDLTFSQLMREIVGQLQDKECLEKRKEKLLEEFNRLLFKASDEDRKTVLFIDEGNAMKPRILDSLRLLTNMQDDTENLLTIVLAGQPELGRRLENPRRDNLFQRIGVYCKIEKIDSLQTMTDYIEHRLERAGLSGQTIFTEAAYKVIWEFSEHGIPRLINKICKLSLKAGQTNNVKQIDAGLVEAIAARFRHFYRPMTKKKAMQQGIPAQPARAETKTAVMKPKERELIAAKLATEQLQKLSSVVTDPYLVWRKLRDKILDDLNHHPPMHRHAAA